MNIDYTDIKASDNPFDFEQHSTLNYQITLSKLFNNNVRTEAVFTISKLIVEIDRVLNEEYLNNAESILMDIYYLYCKGSNIEINTFLLLSKKAAKLYRDILKKQRISSQRHNDRFKKYVCKLTYFLNEYVDSILRSNSDQNLTENTISFNGLRNPWDVVINKEEIYIIDSGLHNNFFCFHNNQMTFNSRIELPTWIDFLEEGVIVGGSSYSTNIFLYYCQKKHIEIIDSEDRISGIHKNDKGYLLFTFEGKVKLCKDLNNKKHVLVNDIPDFFIDKTFQEGEYIYLISFTSEGYIIKYNIKQNNYISIYLDEMIACNDIIVTNRLIYAIDKMQGYLFEYELNGKLRNKYLGFGENDRQLIDPISLAQNDDKIIVVNWVNNKIAEYKGVL